MEFLDLSLSYLPPLQSLKDDKVAEKELKGFRDRLSLGSDCDCFCGDPDADHWIRSARRFKQAAYGFEYDSWS